LTIACCCALAGATTAAAMAATVATAVRRIAAATRVLANEITPDGKAVCRWVRIEFLPSR